MKTILKTTTWAAMAVAAGLLAGCGPSQEQIRLAKAMSARVDRQPTYNDSARVLHAYCQKHDQDYVVWGMDYASVCLMGGNYDAAKEELLKCYADIAKRQDKDRETIAAVSNEGVKIFKGEPYERAMLCCYLGLIYYMDGDYNNARIFFAQADMQNATKAENMKDYRHDFQLGHYWLGRTYMKLAEGDNARVAFTKASQRVPLKDEEKEQAALRENEASNRETRMRLETQSYQEALAAKPPVAGATDMTASPPEAQLPADQKDARGENPVELSAKDSEQFFSPEYQREVNLILVVELGVSPVKFLGGYSGSEAQIMRVPYAERKVMVYLDGHQAGTAFQLVDLYRQAQTRGHGEKDKAQQTKEVAKFILDQIPYVSDVSSHWDIRADGRFWGLLPGEVHVYAAKVKPGVYTVNLQSLDLNDFLLPRYSLTRRYVPVKAGQENVYLLHVKADADNCYVGGDMKPGIYDEPGVFNLTRGMMGTAGMAGTAGMSGLTVHPAGPFMPGGGQ